MLKCCKANNKDVFWKDKSLLRKAQFTKKVGKKRNGWEVNRRRMKLERKNEKQQILQSTFHWSSKNWCCGVKRINGM